MVAKKTDDNKPNIQLDVASQSKVTISGKDLNMRWLSDYVLIWSGKNHPYENIWDDEKGLHGFPQYTPRKNMSSTCEQKFHKLCVKSYCTCECHDLGRANKTTRGKK